MATQVKEQIVLIPWSEVQHIRVNEEGPQQGEYEMKGRGRDGQLRGYDISAILPDPDPDRAVFNELFMSYENGPGKGWTHKMLGKGDNPYVFNAVARRMNNDQEWLLLRKSRRQRDEWYVIGNPFCGEVEIHTGGRHDAEGNWTVTDPLDFEIECPYQLYPVCLYHGDIEAHPIEDFFTQSLAQSITATFDVHPNGLLQRFRKSKNK